MILFDAGPLIDLERNKGRWLALLREARETNARLMTTEAVVAQVWAGPANANLSRVLKQFEIEPLFGDHEIIGPLSKSMSKPDVVDASLVYWAKRRDCKIATNDHDDLAPLCAQLGVTLA